MKVGTRVGSMLLAALVYGSAEIQAAEHLSGEYLLRFEQTEKSCGARIAPLELRVAVELRDRRLRITAPVGFLGVELVTVDYDEGSGSLSTSAQSRVDLGETNATLKLDVEGRLVRRDPPRFGFDVVFDKIADDPAWNCTVKGTGSADKVN